MPTATESNNLSFERSGDATMVIRLAGEWHLARGMPSAKRAEHELGAGRKLRRVIFDARQLAGWDSSLVGFVAEVCEFCRRSGIEPEPDGLPAGVRRLLRLAEAVPEKKDARELGARRGLVEEVGAAALRWGESTEITLAFLGELTLAFGNLLLGRARYRGRDLLEVIQQCGADALGIVTLISFLVGVILAFMGAVQLQQFGASIYVADLVGIGMVRDMGAMMTAIIMAGRTGAAFAAELGTMKVTQEIDAYTTMGVSPMEFLVMPRVLALVLMMPLLCLYSDILGILGGAAIGAGMLGVSVPVYLGQTMHAVTGGDVVGGLVKGTVYGVVVAIAGCLRGFKCGTSSSAVGEAATQAVVTGIVGIVVACGIFAVVFHVLGV